MVERADTEQSGEYRCEAEGLGSVSGNLSVIGNQLIYAVDFCYQYPTYLSVNIKLFHRKYVILNQESAAFFTSCQCYRDNSL